MTPRRFTGRTAALGLATALLAGCVSLDPKPDPTRYYVIGEPAGSSAAPPDDCPRTILVGPVRVAGYADQTALVERRGEHEIVPLTLHRWAEPPGQALPRALTRRLAQALPGQCVVTFQRKTPGADTLQLELEFTRFELTDHNQAVIALQWRTFAPGSDGRERTGGATATQSFDAADDRVGAGINALSQALDEIVRQLADQVAAR